MNNVDFQISGLSHSRPVTVAQALVNGTGLLSRLGMESARLDAELLLGTALGLEREQLYINYERTLDPADHALYLSLLQRRTRWEPMAYIIGRREFWSLEFTLTPAVLVPRPETELLVEQTLRQLEELERDIGPSGPKSNFRILDLGTGCGAIAVSLAKERNDVEIWATDLSSAALEVAQSNAQQHGVQERIRFIHGELFEPLENRMGFFHGIVSNPPYVNRREMENLPQEVRWEPRLALEAGPDGLDLYRRIIPRGHLYLKDQGFMALEMGSDMGKALRSLFGTVGRYSEASVHQDYAGRERVITARKATPPGKPDRKG